jgi:hypothetical protein
MLRRADPGFTPIHLQAFEIALQPQLDQPGGCGIISTQGRHLKPRPLEAHYLYATQFRAAAVSSARAPRAAILMQ